MAAAAAAEYEASQFESVPDDAEIDGAFLGLALSTPSRDRVPLTAKEQSVLNLYDQLSEIRLEHALLQVQQNHGQGFVSELSSDEAKLQLRAAERECLEARSRYLLQNSAIEDILSTAPVLKAIHWGPSSGPLESALRPLIDDRDVLAMAHANLSTRYRSIVDSLTSQEAQNMVLIRRNQESTAKLFGLTDQLKTLHPDSTTDAEIRSNLKSARDDMKETKRRWRIMKSLVAAVVAGSGVDWAHDDDLRDLVLDDED